MEEMLWQPVEGGEQEQPSTGSELLRHLLRTDVNIGKTIFGFPGQVGQLALSGANALSNLLTGSRPLPEKIPGLSTPESIQEGAEQWATKLGKSPEYLRPQSQNEGRADEVIKDLTSAFMFPAGATRQAVARLAGVGLGNLAKWGAEEVPLLKNWAEPIKLGTMLTTTLAGSPSLYNQAKQFYNKARSYPIRGIDVNAKPVISTIEDVIDHVNKGDIGTQGKAFLDARLPDLVRRIDKNGKMPLEQAVAFIEDYNSFFRNNDIPWDARSYMGKLIDGLGGVVEGARTQAPDFVNAFQPAREIWRTINTTSSVNGILQHALGKVQNKITNPVVAYLVGLKPSVLGYGATQAVRGASGMIDRALRSNAVLDHYKKAVIQAGKGNIGAASRDLVELDKALNKAAPELWENVPEENNQEVWEVV